MSDAVLLTGATGFLSVQIARRLIPKAGCDFVSRPLHRQHRHKILSDPGQRPKENENETSTPRILCSARRRGLGRSLRPAADAGDRRSRHRPRQGRGTSHVKR